MYNAKPLKLVLAHIFFSGIHKGNTVKSISAFTMCLTILH